MEPFYRLRVPERLEGLNVIRADPLAGKELRDDLAGLRSFRVGRFRIIYRVAPRRLIELVALGPRRSIYENTLRLLRPEPGHRRVRRAEFSVDSDASVGAHSIPFRQQP